MVFIGTMTISTFMKNNFFTDFDENWHVDAHYRTDEGYFVKMDFCH